jgi:hypothetical protein
MKKLLLLLLPFFAMAQSPDATQIENILLLNNTKQNSATRVIVQDSITKELKFVLRASLVPQANASTSGTVRTTTAEVNPQVYTIGIVDNKLDAKLNVNQKGALNGVATLNSIGKIPNEQIPAVAISETFPISSEAQMIALSQAEQGDIAIRSDVSKAFILRQSPSSVLGNWSELLTPASTVTSVAGKVGAVILNSNDVGLGNVNNTSDLNKPISTSTQTALNAKISGSGTTNQVARFTFSGAVGNSGLLSDGTNITVSNNATFNGASLFNGNLFADFINPNTGNLLTILNGGSNNLLIRGNTVVQGSVTAAPATVSTELATLGQVRPYKVYTALLSQSGTNAPFVIVLENTLEGTLVWSVSSVGIYLGTLTGAFTLNKTVSFISGDQSADKGYGIDNLSSVDYVRISTRLAGSLNHNQLNKASIEIRVYN